MQTEKGSAKMIGKKMEEAINRQINAEIYSAYLYFSMEAFFEAMGLKGFANWMRVQTQEELFHASKFYDYLNARDGRVILKAIEAPPVEWKSPLEVFEEAYKHEVKVTGLIHDLVTLALEEKDHASHQMLGWFVNEQVEEEANASQIASELKLIGDDKKALLMIDRELAARVYTPPAVAGAQP